jgi:formate C-acetyltransferase
MGGRDRNGPTAALRSVTKIDHVEMLQGLLYNQKFHPTCLDTPGALQNFVDYLKVFCELGGHHIQFNVVTAESLRRAQENPEDCRDLIVRVAGYSAYFAELNRRTQDEIINRTEMVL